MVWLIDILGMGIDGNDADALRHLVATQSQGLI
jgi:hypothetical protein